MEACLWSLSQILQTYREIIDFVLEFIKHINGKWTFSCINTNNLIKKPCIVSWFHLKDFKIYDYTRYFVCLYHKNGGLVLNILGINLGKLNWYFDIPVRPNGPYSSLSWSKYWSNQINQTNIMILRYRNKNYHFFSIIRKRGSKEFIILFSTYK